MKVFLFFIFFIYCSSYWAQESTDQQLAQYYYNNGDFVKALPYCQKVYSKEHNKFTFMRYYDCLLKMQKDKEAEKLLKKQLDSEPENIDYEVMLGDFYEKHDELKLANKLYQKLIEENSGSSIRVLELYRNFKANGKFDYALQLLSEARKKLKDSYPLHLQFADYYASQSQFEKMLKEYLDFIAFRPEQAEQVQMALAMHIDFSQDVNPVYDLLREALLERVQERNSTVVYSEMLIWLFTQKKQFSLALNQAQAMDKRERGDGVRVYDMANLLLQNKEYDLARKGYAYIIKQGQTNPFYFLSEEATLHTRFLELTEQRNFTQEAILQIVNEYQETLNRLGKNRNTLVLVKELAHIAGFYANQPDSAIVLLEKALNFPGIGATQLAEIKLLLGDLYVVKDDIWEASILYMQVDKEFKFETIGFEAKFKNARIFYYDGDFKFAQSQLDILKQSTSKLIANDALKLSLLITDNYGLDSNYVAMKQFAQADLLLEQHQYNQAFKLYDSIVQAFPFHGLNDEILLRKSQAYQQQGKWQEATVLLDELLKNHADDILADDALFQLGSIYQTNLIDKEKAIECYKKILFKYKGSLYGVEARKRLRLLRGDKLDIEDTMGN